jgi:hypothetical protein
MDIAGRIAQARGQHLGLLVDRVWIERATDAATANPYAKAKAWQALTAEPVPALVQAADAYTDQAADPGVDDLRVEPYVVKVPVGTEAAPGDRVVVAVCPLFPALVGERLGVQSVKGSGVAVVTRIKAVRTTPAGVRP